MLWRMAAADDDAPAPPADLDLHAVLEGAVGAGQCNHQAAIAGRAAGLHRLLDVTEADAAVELREFFAKAAGRVDKRAPRMVPLARRGPHLDAQPLGEPAGKPDMVGVIVRHDETGHRAPAKFLRDDPLPE